MVEVCHELYMDKVTLFLSYRILLVSLVKIYSLVNDHC